MPMSIRLSCFSPRPNRSNIHLETMEGIPGSAIGLLDLPVELRLLIYGYLPIDRKEFTCPLRDDNVSGELASWSTLTMSWHHPSLQVLRVSRFLHQEAKDIMMDKLHRISITVPRVSVELSMIRQLFHPCGILSFVTHWYQFLKQSDGQANFTEWITKQAASSPLPMFGMSETMLMFIEQAGHQMLGRTRLLESLRYSDGTATASVFYLVQVIDSTIQLLSVSYMQQTTPPWWPGLDANLSLIRSCMPAQLHNV